MILYGRYVDGLHAPCDEAQDLPVLCIEAVYISQLSRPTPPFTSGTGGPKIAEMQERSGFCFFFSYIVTTYYRLHPDQLSTVSTTARLRAGRQFNCSLRRHVIVQASVISRRSLLSTNKGNRSNRADAPTYLAIGRRENIIYTPHNNTRPPNPK